MRACFALGLYQVAALLAPPSCVIPTDTAQLPQLAGSRVDTWWIPTSRVFTIARCLSTKYVLREIPPSQRLSTSFLSPGEPQHVAPSPGNASRVLCSLWSWRPPSLLKHSQQNPVKRSDSDEKQYKKKTQLWEHVGDGAHFQMTYFPLRTPLFL